MRATTSARGRDNTITWLEQNPAQKEAIEAIVRRKLTEGADVMANSVKSLAAKSAAAETDGSDADDAVVEEAGLAAR